MNPPMSKTEPCKKKKTQGLLCMLNCTIKAPPVLSGFLIYPSLSPFCTLSCVSRSIWRSNEQLLVFRNLKEVSSSHGKGVDIWFVISRRMGNISSDLNRKGNFKFCFFFFSVNLKHLAWITQLLMFSEKHSFCWDSVYFLHQRLRVSLLRHLLLL